jgi:hypothetical protein
VRARTQHRSLFTLQAEELQAAFAPYGAVESVKVIREKGGELLGMRLGSTERGRGSSSLPNRLDLAVPAQHQLMPQHQAYDGIPSEQELMQWGTRGTATALSSFQKPEPDAGADPQHLLLLQWRMSNSTRPLQQHSPSRA